MKNKIIAGLKLMRVKHYIKNILIFLPIIFGKQIFRIDLDIKVLCGFIAYCLVSSIIYIINDMKDIQLDKQHPKKCKRPLAAGEITPKEASALIIFLFLLVVCIITICHFPIGAILVLSTYFLLNIAYSIELKNKPIIDIIILVAGFVLRVIFGAQITGINVSNWLYLTIMALSFYLALGKRRNEMIKIAEQGKEETRKVLKYYNKDFLDKNMYMFLGATIIFYALWCSSPVIPNNEYLIWTIPFVIAIFMKYSLIIEKDSYGDPVEVLLHDKTLILLVLIYAFIMALILYLPFIY